MNNTFVTTKSFVGHTIFLLSGFTLQCIKILVSMIKGYLRIVNSHYWKSGCNKLWDLDNNSDVFLLPYEQIKF